MNLNIKVTTVKKTTDRSKTTTTDKGKTSTTPRQNANANLSTRTKKSIASDLSVKDLAAILAKKVDSGGTSAGRGRPATPKPKDPAPKGYTGTSQNQRRRSPPPPYTPTAAVSGAPKKGTRGPNKKQEHTTINIINVKMDMKQPGKGK